VDRLGLNFSLVFVPHRYRHAAYEPGPTHGELAMSTSIAASDPNCLFCRIVAGQIPSRLVYQDDEIYAFHDIHPWAPVHFLLIPKLHIPSMAQLQPEHEGLLGRMMVLAPRLALQEGCRPYPEGGFRLLSNTGADGKQEVHHLHIHVMGGPRPWLRG
jgi:histidine triad (HIT) family protein